MTQPLDRESEYLQVSHEVGDLLLKSFHQACRELGVSYFISAGTLLGAVRSGGWIPWDDDIDVVMFRDGFEKFRDGCAVLPDFAMFSDVRSSKDQVSIIPRVLYRNSERQAFGRQIKSLPPERRHIALDIFILDRGPKSARIARIWRASIRVIERMITLRRTTPISALAHGDHSLAKRVVGFLGALVSRPLSDANWRWLYDRMVRLWAGRSGSDPLFLTNDFKLKFRSIKWEEGDFTPAQEMKFGSLKVSGPARPDAILTRMYGANYLTPPNQQMRRPLHLRNGLTVEIGGRMWSIPGARNGSC